jgi:hypothetical protein
MRCERSETLRARAFPRAKSALEVDQLCVKEAVLRRA